MVKKASKMLFPSEKTTNTIICDSSIISVQQEWHLQASKKGVLFHQLCFSSSYLLVKRKFNQFNPILSNKHFC